MANVMWHLSNKLYNGLSDMIGTSEVIKMRRELADLLDHINTHPRGDLNRIRSGSNREGFRFSESDIDLMVCRKAMKAVCFLPQRQHYYESNYHEALVLMEVCDSRPGFALLQVLSSSLFDQNKSLCLDIAGKLYFSSSYMKANMHEVLDTVYNFHCDPHGPCACGIKDDKEIDIALCIQCDDWPPQASEFLSRCSDHRCLWPTPPLLKDIVDGGCHLVPIGAKGSINEIHEWRISFSVAEQKLVYSLNHSQFLCYGMLKLFLKEVINKEIKDNQLCSYFLKTALFWENQSGYINIWCRHNILFCFWRCFKRLIKWVFQENCPNFFIRNNNMFHGKIHGYAQQQLFEHLYGLYELGFLCVLKSKSLNSMLNPINRLCNIQEEFTLSQSCFQSQLISEVTSFPLLVLRLSSYVDKEKLFEGIRHLSTIDLSRNQKIAIDVYKKFLQEENLPDDLTKCDPIFFVSKLREKVSQILQLLDYITMKS